MIQIQVPFEKAVKLVEKDTNGKFVKFENNIFILEVGDNTIHCFKCKRYVRKEDYHEFYSICKDCMNKGQGR